MDRMTIIALQRVISPLVSEQIRNIKQVQRVNLDPKDLEEKPDDSVMTREIKTQVKERLAENNKQLASHAVDIIDKAIEAEDKHLEIGRRLRKEADIAFTKARTIFNARTHLIEKGEALPIALELALLNPADVGIVSEHVKTLNVPDYFAQRNKVEADKTS